MLRVLIVDDEKSGRNMLELLLRRYNSDVELVQACEDADTALKTIEEHHPDVVFLDIEMPGMNAFEMLNQLQEITFDIVFVTAHGHYAIRAFEFSAFDYLLKPVNAEKLSATIQRLKKKKTVEGQKLQLELLLSHLKQPLSVPEKIAVPTAEGLLFIPVNSLVRCEADKNYTHLFLNDKRKVLVSKTLKEFEILLQDAGFIRVHRSHLINLKYVDKYVRGEGGYVIMSDQATIDISPLHKEEFLKKIYRV